MRRGGADCFVVVMKALKWSELERRRQVTAVELGQSVRREEPFVQWKAAASAPWHEPYKSRGLYTVL